MSPAKKPSLRNFSLVGLSFLLFCLDVLGKYLALQGLFSHNKSDFFHLGFFANRGVAFSLPVPLPLALIVTVLAIIIFSWLLMQDKHLNRPSTVFLIPAILGSLNNGLDRLIHNWTTDYLFILNRLALNLSDLLVVGGIGLFLWYNYDSEHPRLGT